ncbi:GH92 family glycosyl hydrolase [Marinibactrum halimedae]|uniref:Alpha-1 2-mannosidase n=1 Tax=Marinibactrum halimedae TaxID=1444977 RepID=A0AA37WMI1_9GAMM|nr:GH92 family glycosyl hydrolase [Marinibactrum halimedae]MCD9460701.1 GH92 family glycosyl hydrolase [Marinibactrum halimedae]GLS25176.1 alpha-1 2-mannosidase [Marinibactrum halimedae]
MMHNNHVGLTIKYLALDGRAPRNDDVFSTLMAVVFGFFFLVSASFSIAKEEVDYVNPFIGTSNFGATHPGAQYPHGLASVAPFNVAFEEGKLNKFEKDAAWNSRVYIHENQFLTGFTHLNLSGVGCPEAGVINVMPTTGKLELNPEYYGSTYSNEIATPGYYSTILNDYDIQTEVTSTLRTGLSRFTYPKGESHIIVNLGLGLSNEQGASVKVVSNQEIEGMRTLGTFCYNADDVRPVYFVAKLSKPAKRFGVFKQAPAYKGVEGEWIGYNNTVKPYPNYQHTMAGDDIGAYFSFDLKDQEQVQIKVGLSFVSIDNARENLEKEQPRFAFESTRKKARKAWQEKLEKINVSGKDEDKTLFYTGLYHTLIHPNIIQDVNGQYPLMGRYGVGQTTKDQNRYSVFSLWDTNRNVHPLLSLIYPDLQSEMVNTMVGMYKESGWLPKWELYGMETQVMVGDPATPVIADTYLRGIQDFDVATAYEAMTKSADTILENPLRPENNDYLKLGYVPVDDEGPYDGSVSTSLEYFLADFSLGQLASALGKEQDAERYLARAQGYKKLYDPTTKMLRPKDRKGQWLTPYDPELGRNFEPAPGYIEGNAWNYRFYVPHDMPGLMVLLGGENEFETELSKTFTTDNFDMANEPDITYPFLFNYTNAHQSKTSEHVKALIEEHFHNTPGGLPGNDDTGTLSAWLVFSMMGIYPVSPADMDYAVFAPTFDKITLTLDKNYYEGKKLTIISSNRVDASQLHTRATFNGKPLETPFISHLELTKGGRLEIHR